MIVTTRILVRLVLISIAAVILQLSFFSEVALFHVSPDILPAFVVCLGLLGGTMAGAIAGFWLGLFLDCLLIAPLGGSSLVLLGIGYLAGLFRERFEVSGPLAAPLLCLALTMAAEFGFGALQLLLGLHTAVLSPLLLKDLVLKGIFAFFLSWPIYAGLRRALRPALVEDPTPRRRRGRQPTVLRA